MRLLWVLIAVFGFAAALPASTSRTERLKQILSDPYTPRNAALEGLILGLIEDLRIIMLTGSDTIPVLDPLEIDNLTIDDQILPLPGAHVILEDTIVKNLATFVLNDLSVTMTSLLLQRYRILLDGEIPNLEAEAGNYDMSINVMGFTVFGNGEAKISVIRPRIQVNLLVAPRISGGIFLNILECQIQLSIGDIKAHFTGLFNDDAVSDFVSLILENLVKDLLEIYENEINQFVSTFVHDLANDLLSDFDIGSILG